jgi:hypothetical protein
MIKITQDKVSLKLNSGVTKFLANAIIIITYTMHSIK